MEFDAHVRATLVAYYKAHKLWKDTPPDDKDAKAVAKDLRGAAHSKLLAVGELLAQKPS